MSDGYGNDDFRESPLRMSNKVLIKTVTDYYTGQVICLGAREIVLCDAAWVSETGRLTHALATGELEEVEPVPDGIVSVRHDVVTATFNWNHPLPREVLPREKT